MKIKSGFIRHKVADSYVVVAVGGGEKHFDGMLKLNETGNLIWEKLESGSDIPGLVKALTDEYDVTAEKAAQDVSDFIESMRVFGCIDD